MIIRTLSEIADTERDVAWGNGQSRRFLLARDGMGFTLTDTTIDAGTESLLEYRQHMEACYCIEGEGELVDMDGNVHRLVPGTMYALDKHDRHRLRARTTLRLLCVFLPALQGTERHTLSSAESSSY
jgi:L-ectoine synthase